MYPPMIDDAQAEGYRAKLMFGYALRAEAIHADMDGPV